MIKIERRIKMNLSGALVALLVTVVCINADPTTTTQAPPTPPPKPIPKTDACAGREEAAGRPDSIPQLGSVFETTIVATFLKGTSFQTPHTREVKEYYDLKRNKGAMYQMKDGTTTIHLYDITAEWSFVATWDKANKNYTCTDSSLMEESKSKGMDYFFKFSHDKDGGHLTGLADLYTLGTNNTIYQGEKEIRGIPCKWWSSCVSWDEQHADFIVDWYFSNKNYEMPNHLDDGKPTPVRLEVKGYEQGKVLEENAVTNHSIYDFVSYKEQITDDSVFWPELKTVCGNQKYYDEHHNKTIPTIPDTFSVDLEQITDAGKVSNGKFVMDRINNISRTDLEIIGGEDSNYKTKCKVNGFCKIIHDFNVGIEYVITPAGDCSIYAIPIQPGEKGGMGPADVMTDSQHLDSKNKTAYITMATGMLLFKIHNEDKIYYQGKRKFRGIETEAWVVRPSSSQAYREFHFTKDDPPKLFGYIENGPKFKVTTNFYKYNTKTPDLSAFDIHYCFPNDDDAKKEGKDKSYKALHGRIELKEKWKDVKPGVLKVQPMIRNKLANMAGVNVLRITDMMIWTRDGDEDDDSPVRVWFSLLGPSPIRGSVYTGDGPDATKATDDAKKALEEGLKEDFLVTVKDNDKEYKVNIVGGSLKTDDDVLKGDPRDSQPKSSSGHSDGQMAALGFFMIVLGAIVGLGVGYWLWRRRNRGVPYQIHH